MASRYAEIADVRAVMSETFDDAVIQSALDVTRLLFDPTLWGEKLSVGHSLLAAHFIVSTVGGSDGAVIKEKIEAVEVNYSVSESAGKQFDSSRYGSMFEAFRESLIAMPIVGRNVWPPLGTRG